MSLKAPELEYAVTSWAPGYLDSPDPTRMPKGSTPRAANCLLTSFGPDGACTLSKRQGARLLNPTCISAGNRVDGLYEFRREGISAGELLAVCNGLLRKWDGTTSFTAIASLGMAAGSAIEYMTFRNIVLIMNGTINKLYDGTSVFDDGFVAPTAAPVLAAVAPAGTGLTGTYQSLATWYDSTHDHESSVSPAFGTATLVAQDRQHTKPTGSPPATVDKWRIYVRRTDTNETYFKLVAETAIATGTATEAVPDTTRNLATTLLAPLPNANDVPPVFAFAATALGYRFGVQSNDSFVWVSALGDPQSQHPKDKIGVARGDGQAVTTVKAVGTRIIAQKARKTFHLNGDRMPFLPEELSGSYGNHSQGSSVEAKGLYWAWDDERGPYVTDLESKWESLVDGRISSTLQTINAAAEIRCCHFKPASLVCWIVATGSSTRLRTMLAYNYLAGAWLPPIYGLEYGSISTFQTLTGAVNLYVGDQWGRVYQYLVDAVEGPPSGTLSAAVTSATTGTVVASGAAFYTTGDGLKGMPVAVVDTAGNWQFRTVQSNTATVITIDTTNGSAWSRVPGVGYTVVVGPIDWFWSTPLVNWNAPMRRKKGGYLYAEASASSGVGSSLTVRARLNDASAALAISNAFSLASSGGWGMGRWGTMLWGRGERQVGRKKLRRSFYAIQVEYSNRYPNEPIELVTVGITADGIKGRWAHG